MDGINSSLLLIPYYLLHQHHQHYHLFFWKSENKEKENHHQVVFTCLLFIIIMICHALFAIIIIAFRFFSFHHLLLQKSITVYQLRRSRKQRKWCDEQNAYIHIWRRGNILSPAHFDHESIRILLSILSSFWCCIDDPKWWKSWLKSRKVTWYIPR